MKNNGRLRRIARRAFSFADWASDPLPLQMASAVEFLKRDKNRNPQGHERDNGPEAS